VKGGSLEALRQINAKLLKGSMTSAPPSQTGKEDPMLI